MTVVRQGVLLQATARWCPSLIPLSYEAKVLANLALPSVFVFFSPRLFPLFLSYFLPNDPHLAPVYTWTKIYADRDFATRSFVPSFVSSADTNVRSTVPPEAIKRSEE